METSPSWNFKMYYDGACPLCTREVKFLMQRNRGKTIVFEDTSTPGFDRVREGFLAGTEKIIHGRLPDGRLVSGVEVFRRAYSEIGLGWLVAPTGWPILRPIFDQLYLLISKYRPAIARMFGKPCETQCS